MDFLENIQWFIASDPSTATNKNKKFKKLTKKELDKIVFDDSKETVKLAFPLNDNYSFFVTREIKSPVTIGSLLKFIHDFYQEPLEPEHFIAAFKDNQEWFKEVKANYDDDMSEITKYDVFTDTCDPDFCGLEYDEKYDEYVVGIGPE